MINYLATTNLLNECASSTNETSIQFSDTITSSIPSEIFEHFPALKLLDASRMGLTSIDNLCFDNLPNLTHLNFSNNSITYIPERIFIKCNAIDVNLQQNQISGLNDSAFTGLTKLQRLDLSYNNIVELSEDVFRPLSNMKELRLDFNRLDVIDGKLFEHNALLEVLYLNNNLITVIAEEAFEGLKHLTLLDIDNNSFTKINLMPMKQLRRVNVVNGSLTALEIPDSVTDVLAYNNQIGDIKVSLDSNLTSLMVGKNFLTSLGNFSEHRKLQNLELSFNNITHLNLNAFAKMSQLKELLIFDIKLDKLDADFVLKHLLNLHIIELSPELYEKDELNTFMKRLKERKIVVIADGGKIMNGDSMVHNHTPAPTAPPNKLTTDTATIEPQMHFDSYATIGNIELDTERDRQLTNRIQRLEQIIQSTDAQRAEHQYHQNIDENLHSLRVLIFVTICATSLLVAFQIFIFVRNNYTRIRIQTNTMLSNGRARSHEPMLEEVF